MSAYVNNAPYVRVFLRNAEKSLSKSVVKCIFSRRYAGLLQANKLIIVV